jgi:hypothetical protein
MIHVDDPAFEIATGVAIIRIVKVVHICRGTMGAGARGEYDIVPKILFFPQARSGFGFDSISRAPVRRCIHEKRIFYA